MAESSEFLIRESSTLPIVADNVLELYQNMLIIDVDRNHISPAREEYNEFDQMIRQLKTYHDDLVKDPRNPELLLSTSRSLAAVRNKMSNLKWFTLPVMTIYFGQRTIQDIISLPIAQRKFKVEELKDTLTDELEELERKQATGDSSERDDDKIEEITETLEAVERYGEYLKSIYMGYEHIKPENPNPSSSSALPTGLGKGKGKAPSLNSNANAEAKEQKSSVAASSRPRPPPANIALKAPKSRPTTVLATAKTSSHASRPTKKAAIEEARREAREKRRRAELKRKAVKQNTDYVARVQDKPKAPKTVNILTNTAEKFERRMKEVQLYHKKLLNFYWNVKMFQLRPFREIIRIEVSNMFQYIKDTLLSDSEREEANTFQVRMNASVLVACRDVVESYLVTLLSHSNIITQSDGRVVMKPDDIRLVRHLRFRRSTREIDSETFTDIYMKRPSPSILSKSRQQLLDELRSYRNK
jgi:histone H3/H4